MANVLSTNYSAQLVALSKGPGRGVSAPTASATLRTMSDKASMPVATLLSTEHVRFMKVPKGAIIYPHLCHLSTNHTAAIPGKIQLVPLDGSAAQDITGVTALLENTAVSGNAETPVITSFPDVADDTVVAADSWVQFVPTSDTVIASAAKDLRLRIAYGQTY